MRLLLDEMISAVVAEQLRHRGHDVAAVQDAAFRHLRGIDDCSLLDLAVADRRALATDNVPDFFRCHQALVEAGRTHYGLLFFTNQTFPRHRHHLFVGQILAALHHQLRAQPGDEASSWIKWLDRHE